MADLDSPALQSVGFSLMEDTLHGPAFLLRFVRNTIHSTYCIVLLVLFAASLPAQPLR